MKNGCIDISIYGEKNYKLFLEVLKLELDRARYSDLTATQALILLRIHDSVISVGEVMSRGYYMGSNASYNLKKLTNAGYISSVPSDYDKRSALIKLTKRGLDLCTKISKSLNLHLEQAAKKTNNKIDIDGGLEFLKSVERFWNDILRSRI